MTEAAADPYAVLGVSREVSEDELRRVYRALVQRHHPDHNGGSPDSARRFAEIQRAYAAVAELRRAAATAPPAAARPAAFTDPQLDTRIAELERELAARREAERRRIREQTRLARERAADAAPEGGPRPTPEELGYYSTQDSFTQIIDDAAEQLGQRLSGSDAKKQFARRLSDLFGREG